MREQDDERGETRASDRGCYCQISRIRAEIYRTMTPGIGLRALRELHELTTEQLSAVTQLTSAHLLRLEQSKDDLKLDLAKKLAVALHTSPAVLMAWNKDA